MAISDSVFNSFDQCSTLSCANCMEYSEDPKGAPTYGRPELVMLTLVSAKAAVALERQKSLITSHVLVVALSTSQ